MIGATLSYGFNRDSMGRPLPRTKPRRTRINRGVHSSNIGEATRFPIRFSFFIQDPRDL